MSTLIENIRRNSMGTASFGMKLKGMRKFQDFIVYPMQAGDDTAEIKIQSDTRIGKLNLTTGKGRMSQSHANGAYFMHLQLDKLNEFELNPTSLEAIRTQIKMTASAKAGTNGIIFCDNSQADKI